MNRKPNDSTTIAAGHIGWLEATAITFVYTVAKIFDIFPARMAAGAQTAAWSVPIVSGILSALWIGALVSVLKANPGKDIITISRSLLGPYVAFVLGIVFYLFNLAIVVTGAAEMADNVITVLLPLTPKIFLSSVTLVVSLYVALKGIEVLGRVCLTTASVLIALFLVVSALSVNMWEVDSVFPLLGPGAAGLLKTYVIRQAIYGEVLSLGVLAPYLRRPKDLNKVAVRVTVVAAATLSLAMLTCQMVFPYPSLTRAVAPLLRVTRVVNLGRFFQRSEAISAPAWLVVGHVYLAIGILIAALALGSTLNTKRLNLLIVITAGLAIVLAQLIPNMGSVMVSNFDIVRPYSVILLDGWPIALWAASRYRARACRGKEALQEE